MDSLKGKHTDRIRKLAGECIGRFGLINENDRILAGLSGGKDSFVLMHLLEHLQQHAPVDFSLTAATFDPGFEGFGVEQIAAYCAEHHWEHQVVKMDIPAIIREKNMYDAPCMLCSRLRRGKLYGLAAASGCGSR